MKHAFAVSIFLLLCLPFYAQLSPVDEAKIDSLQQVIASARHDSVVVNAWLSWDALIYRFDTELDIRLNEKVDSLCRLNLKNSLTASEIEFFGHGNEEALNSLGAIYFLKGDNDKALTYYQQSLEIAKKIQDSIGIARSYNNMGVLHKNRGDIIQGIESYTNSYKISEAIGYTKIMATTVNNIGSLYHILKEDQTAMLYFQHSYKLAQKVDDLEAQANALNNIGNVHELDEQDSLALVAYFASLDIREEINDQIGIRTSLVNIGVILEKQGKFEEAISHFENCLEIAKGMGDKEGTSICLRCKGGAYLNQGKLKLAIPLLRESLQIAEELEALEESQKSTKALWQCYKELGQYEEALTYYESFVEKSDQLSSATNKNELIRQEFQYSYEKQKAIDDAEHSKTLALEQAVKKRRAIVLAALGIGFLLALIFLIILFNRFRVTRQQNVIIEFEKRRSEELLLNILPAETAEELKTKGFAEPQPYDMATVLFTDFKGFTQIAEHLSPKELVEEINYCFKAFDEIIGKYGIEKIKTIGDAYMAAGGLPVVNPHNAKDVVNAALDIRDFMQKYWEERQAEGKTGFEIRIGIHSGPVIAGIVGIKKFAYDIWGDTVNTASRMESSGAPGKVNISDSTYALVMEDFQFEYRGKVAAKNKADIDMYFVDRLEAIVSKASA